MISESCKRWSRKWDKCVECGRTDSRHSGKGLCFRCRKRKVYASKHKDYRKMGEGWSRKYDCCQKCGTSTIPHIAKGLCMVCYFTKEGAEHPYTPRTRWARMWDYCIRCGTTETKHHSNGLCRVCINSIRDSKKRSRDLKILINIIRNY